MADLIEKLMQALDAERPARPETQYDIGYNNGLTMAMAIARKTVAEAPTVEAVEVVHGRWVKDKKASENHVEAIYVCSACQNWEAWGEAEKTNYCPNCGAKMDLEVDNGN